MAEELPEASWSEASDAHGYVHIHLPKTKETETSKSFENKDANMAETHTFPKELPDWSNLDVIHKNTLPPRSSFFLFDNETDALTRDASKSRKLSLSGTWKFSVAKSPFDTPPEFYEKDYDVSQWGDIEVPGMWQLQGYGRGPQ